MKAIVAFFCTWICGFLGVYTGLWTCDDLLLVFYPAMMLLLAYWLAKALTGPNSLGKWVPRCARTGRFLPKTIYKGGALTKPRKLSYPPTRLEHAVIRNNQPSPYSN